MKHLKLFENHNRVYTGQEVSDEFVSLGEGHGDPHHTEIMSERIKKWDYTLEEVSIQNILSSDIDLKHFIGQMDDDDNEFYEEEMEDNYDSPIIIAQWHNEDKSVIDGYHRIAQHIRNGDDKINAYVYIK